MLLLRDQHKERNIVLKFVKLCNGQSHTSLPRGSEQLVLLDLHKYISIFFLQLSPYSPVILENFRCLFRNIYSDVCVNSLQKLVFPAIPVLVYMLKNYNKTTFAKVQNCILRVYIFPLRRNAYFCV